MVLIVDAKLVYNWIREIIEKTSRLSYRPNEIHVGEISGCLRRAYFDRRLAKPTLDIRNVIFLIGNGVHYWLQALLKEQGWEAEKKVEQNLGEFKIVGHIDLYNPKERILLELKTVGKAPVKPYLVHLRQVNSYTVMVRARKGYIVYIAKDGYIKVFDVKPDFDLWKKTRKRAYQLWYALQRNQPPRPEFSILCQYCPWKWKCYG